MQTTSHIMMIRPVNFSFNAETAVNNAFQVATESDDAQDKAAAEFDGFVGKLQQNGIDVTVIHDTPEPYTPDSIFPNNWVSFHDDGTVVLYPMFAVNRRAERKPQVLENIFGKFDHSQLIDWSKEEAADRFLEGTGSMVLDRENKICYACLSPRTSQELVGQFCQQFGYSAVTFFSRDQQGREIYHTNVMMCVADQYVVICLDSITDPAEREMVAEKIRQSGKKIIEISIDQMNSFAGNMLQVNNKDGKKFLVMSSQAYHSLSANQQQELESFNPIIHSDITTIETNGGGSARCMMAEVFLPLKSLS
ncbi:citrulline utilization hydrolase CtlX [Flavihumibacter sp. ZG627]|uniref:citrulline utilization hydrolase CtlX n=1 Tax=Flavihumibacter sp. ZG627 TaxID=1463156 RepID=UPI00057CC01E|nr:arginine deiminase-related protein [Flavihumibacter sp. ZG627]KIC91692.1 amidinotransferase [Flavihumibacter sp. ZG627]